ncbi:MAG: SRPBCC family protein [Anaerolineales bacterium]|nr:SRPBCC family protein [Anaerolineales bacterium]
MASIKKSITIDAPVEKIYEFINEPTNLLEVWPSMVEATDIERLPNGGTKFNWKYKMAGMTFNGSSEDIEVIAGERIVSKTKGGIDSTITWIFEGEETKTNLTIETEYTVPVPLLGKLAEKFIVKTNDRETETILKNMKDRLES